MAVTMVLEMPGVSQGQYDRVLSELGMPSEGELGEGQLCHIASPMDGGWRVVDVWESEEAFGRFFTDRLSAALAAAGVSMEGGSPPKFFPVRTYRARSA